MKAWLLAAVLAQVASHPPPSAPSRLPALGERAAAEPDDGSGPAHPLFFRLKAPVLASQRSLQAKLRARFPELSLVCEAGGTAYVDVGSRDAARLLGRHAVLDTVAGMGNGIGADEHTARVEPASFVPPFLRPHVARVWFDDDPKFELVHRGKVVPCSGPPAAR